MAQNEFAVTNGIPVLRTHDIGTTQHSKNDLETYLRSINHLYTAATYNLLTHNCNNFSDCLTKYLTGNGIPSYIIDLPQTVFSSPRGAMLRPMFENMQNSIQGNTSSRMDPFGGYSSGSTQQSITSPSVSVPIDFSDQPRPPIPPHVLSPYELSPKPLISAEVDPNTLKIMTNKILKVVENISESDAALIMQTSSYLITKNTQQPDSYPETSIFPLLSRLIAEVPASQLPCLFMMRLLVLPSVPWIETFPEVVQATVGVLIERVVAGASAFGSAPAAVMAWCTVSNILATRAGQLFVFSSDFGNRLLDAAATGLSHDRKDMRAICNAVVLNFTFACTNCAEGGGWRQLSGSDSQQELHASAVQILCAVMEGVLDEQDEACRIRRLTILLRTLRACGGSALSLASDIGLVEVVTELSKASNSSAPEKTLVADLRIIAGIQL